MREAGFGALGGFCGVSPPAVADFRPPIWHPWVQNWEEMRSRKAEGARSSTQLWSSQAQIPSLLPRGTPETETETEKCGDVGGASENHLLKG